MGVIGKTKHLQIPYKKMVMTFLDLQTIWMKGKLTLVISNFSIDKECSDTDATKI
ncbi:MAG: hypothetical protein K0R18_1411 [Bacillales bacterium]|jgi:hypothetical protein|nr:hypothetical protein [Bacillales bacterium]